MTQLSAYRVILRSECEDGGYVARVPAFPAIVTQGDDISDALAMAQDAIARELVAARAAGRQAPAPDADSETLVETVVV
jgi:predicted RNase H-like HicB family nuclease